MNLKFVIVFCSILTSLIAFAQGNKKSFIYASLEAKHAKDLQQNFPHQIEILITNNNLSSVYMDDKLTSELHQKILSHGPGFMFHPSKDEAIEFIDLPQWYSRDSFDYSITEQNFVNEILEEVDEKKIEDVILKLEAYKTRYHLKTEANLAAEELKSLWEKMIKEAGRENDISVKLVTHLYTPMKSVILTIKGSELSSEYVIIGGHLDSIISGNNQSFAPGADDNASGIATITEVLRVLLEKNYKPQRTVEMMAYAAEEIGLVGSNEIASAYKNEGKNVFAYVQFDMTGYKGSPDDIYVTTDSFVNNNLNLFLYDLMEEYNKKGKHQFTYNNTKCNYGCSDHYSWAMKGYPAAFPFEASFNDSNNKIHTIEDTFTNLGNSTNHAAKFVKLGLEFVVEAAKRKEVLSVNDLKSNQNKFYVNNKMLGFEIDSKSRIKSLSIINVAGQKVYTSNNQKNKDQINLSYLSNGAYILVVHTEFGSKISYKFLLN